MPGDRAARKLTERLADAETNVTITVDDAWRQGRLGDQLWNAVYEWRARVTRVRQEVATASRLTGDARQVALKQLRRRVEAIEEAAERIVEVAFTGRLTPDDRLQEVVERLDALDQAYNEVDELDPSFTPRWVRSRLKAFRANLPGGGT